MDPTLKILASLIVGEGSLKILNVDKVIRRGSTFVTLLEKWKQFGRAVGVCEVTLLSLERKLCLQTVQLEDIPYELLSIWKSNNGRNATLLKLYDAVCECGNLDIAELLEIEFCRRKDKHSTTSATEDEQMQQQISYCFNVQGNIYTLEKLTGGDTLKYHHVYRELRKLHITPNHQASSLVRENLFPRKTTSYYIPRTLSYSTKVDTKIFSVASNRENILLVKGLRKYDLVKLTGYQPVDGVANQLENLTVYILLEETPIDFDLIYEKHKKPTHLLEYRKGSLTWRKSRGNCDIILEFLNDMKYFSEDDLVIELTNQTPAAALFISASPGMGKTFLLENLARKTKVRNPETIVLFIVLSEFIQCIQTNDISTKSVIESVASYASSNEAFKYVLREMIVSGNYKFNLFLDGYDEVPRPEQLEALLQILKSLKNFQIVTTSRTHRTGLLGAALHQLPYQIKQFTEGNQIFFLEKYWIEKYEATEGPLLTKFARRCLQALNDRLSDNDSDKEARIAEVPFQSMMLAELKGSLAKRFSIIEAPEVEIHSFFGMYEEYVRLKFQRVLEPEIQQQVLNAHVYHSIKLLFPHMTDKLTPYLTNVSKVDENIVYSVGIIEPQFGTNLCRFSHRTFAEYFFAQFLVSNIGKSGICVGFMMKVILGRDGVELIKSTKHPTFYALKHPVIAYFLEKHLEIFLKPNQFEIANTKKIEDEDISMALAASCLAGFERCFDVGAKIWRKNNKAITLIQKFHLQDEYFKHLPLLATIGSRNVISLVEKALKFTNQEFGVDLGYHIYYSYNQRLNPFYSILFPWVPHCTPLHLVAYIGDYNMFTSLLRLYGESVRDLKYLLHVCLNNSACNPDSIISNKLSIIDLLLRHIPNLLEDVLDNRTPILQDNIHINLLQHICSKGADINAHSVKHGTVLHMTNDGRTYFDFLDYCQANAFLQINKKGKFKRTPLMDALSKFTNFGDEYLTKFFELGADLNRKDAFRNPVLFYFLENSTDPDLIRNVLDHGAESNINHVNKFKETAAHALLTNKGQDSRIATEILKLLIARGFNLINFTDDLYQSPLHLAMKLTGVDGEFVDYFHKIHADFNVIDKYGDSPLFYAIESMQNLDVIRRILHHGGSLRHLNFKGENALDVAKRCKNIPAVEFFTAKRGNRCVQMLRACGWKILIVPFVLPVFFWRTIHTGLQQWLRDPNSLPTYIVLGCVVLPVVIYYCYALLTRSKHSSKCITWLSNKF